MHFAAQRLWTGLITIACLAGLAACGEDKAAPQVISTPNVVSDTVAAASSALQAVGLTLGAQSNAQSASVPSGEIISQSPAAGTSVPIGSAVAVVVSTGPATVNVPNLASDTVAAATTALQAVGLTLGTQTTASSATVPSGEIISQSPAAGTTVATGSAVAVTVSSGVSIVSIPNLVSDTVAQATTALDAVGLTLGNQVSSSSSTVPSGEIISQNPAAGTNVASGSAVAIVVSTGAASSEVVLHSFGSGTDGQTAYGTLIQGTDGNFYGTTKSGGAFSTGFGTVFKITPAGVETVLYSFTVGSGGFGDGFNPSAGLIQGIDGNFYGTTTQGGANNAGTVFKITPAGVESIVYSFTGVDGDGFAPYASLIQTSDGTLYGTTASGGANSAGTVFSVTPEGMETVLHSFGAGSDGQLPYAPLIQGSDGNFYGTTAKGGSTNTGTVFKITPAGAETVLYSFRGLVNGIYDGEYPYAGLIQGSDGNFYGTTTIGGSAGTGALFKMTPAGVETLVHSFGTIATDGVNPYSALIEGNDGNFYGTTEYGGEYTYGTVFKITPEGAETVLHEFGAGNDGAAVYAGLALGSDGNLYGTTLGGGVNQGGTVFKIVP
jgi:uncharacterized repeat protein (TIGR03803 family)